MLLSNLRSLTQLYTLTMDVHARLRTDAHQTVTGEQTLQVMVRYGKQVAVAPASASAAGLRWRFAYQTVTGGQTLQKRVQQAGSVRNSSISISISSSTEMASCICWSPVGTEQPF
jgi:hypothetical protein